MKQKSKRNEDIWIFGRCCKTEKGIVKKCGKGRSVSKEKMERKCRMKAELKQRGKKLNQRIRKRNALNEEENRS